MSNEQTNSHRSGDSRRRSRTRGGRSGSGRNDGGSNYRNRSQRSEEYHPQSSRSERKVPAKPLTWWQKLLQAIGLGKAPAARPPSKPATPERAPSPAKSNTRNIRSGEGPPPEDKPRRSPRGESKSRGGDPSTVESARVYVGNLSYDVTEHDLEELFKGVGGVRNVEIVYNRATHRSKGYGFVEMLHRDEAMRSVEVLNDQPFMGRKLVVSGAKARGSDERDENEERGPEQRVVVAPVPASSAARDSASREEPVIETVHELVEEESRPA